MEMGLHSMPKSGRGQISLECEARLNGQTLAAGKRKNPDQKPRSPG